MSFSHYAGVAIVPTLSRIVLAMTFINAGYKKVFTSSDFTLDEARKLQNWNITVTPAPTVAMAIPTSGRTPQWDTVYASYTPIRPATSQYVAAEPAAPGPAATDPAVAQAAAQPAVPETTQTPPAQTTQPATPETTKPPEPPQVIEPVVVPAAPQVTPTTAPAPAPETAPAVVPHQPAPTSPSMPTSYTATSMYKIALMVDQAGWPQPKMQAWLAAFTELGGGVLLLLGLFSRLWGLGLSIVMGTAFYLTSLPGLQAHGWNLMHLNDLQFSTLMIQLAMFVLAFGILLTGPGPLSIDRILFGGPRDDLETSEGKRE